MAWRLIGNAFAAQKRAFGAIADPRVGDTNDHVLCTEFGSLDRLNCNLMRHCKDDGCCLHIGSASQ